MRWLAGIFLCGVLCAQDNSLLEVLRGDLLEVEQGASRGEFSIRLLSDNSVHRCTYDEKTYFEKDKVHAAANSLTAGQQLEVISDRNLDHARCYARTVRSTDVAAVRRQTIARLNALMSNYHSPLLDTIAPRGNLTFAGVVLRVSPDTLVLHTRADGIRSMHLRQDTRFLSDGTQVGVSKLIPNTHVFVRAGKNLDDEMEVYQVVWGEILTPQE